MNFNEEFIEGILSGEKVMTRRLVKEGEDFLITFYELNARVIPRKLIIKKNGMFNATGTLKRWNPFVWVLEIEVLR